jgi:serine/threonine protein kinase
MVRLVLHKALGARGTPSTAGRHRDHNVTTSTASESAVAQQIGKYQVIAELARGGMGNVYLAASLGPGGFSKLHAVKELKPSLCADETYVTMFLEEARLAARLIHPNIVQTNEVGSDGGRHFIVMEFLDGRSLHRIGKRFKGGLPANAHLRVITEALLGLQHAHDLRGFDGNLLGVVHRDVSPLNVFVTFDGQAKVIDFGIAKTALSALDTRAGILKGRIAYMSPEQANGARVDRRTDVYSAGVMIWEAAAGRRLWPGMSESEILTRVAREPAPSLRSVLPAAPEELNLICTRAMAHRREDRYTSAADLFGDLDRYLARVPDAMTMREIGAAVGKAFADERSEMNRLIEKTLARLPRGLGSGMIRVMPKSRTPPAGTMTDADDEVEASLAPTRRLFTPSGSFGPNSGNSRSAPATAASLPPALDAETKSPATKRAGLRTVGAGVLLLGVLLFGASWHRGRAAAPALAAPAAAGPSLSIVSTSNAEPQSKSHVVVTAFPKAAQIYVDEAAVTNPYIADSVPDATLHRLRVEAPGYQPMTRMIAFADDISLEITLDPARPPAAVRHTPVQANQPPSQRPNCQPPYVVDSRTGAKRWRLECL